MITNILQGIFVAVFIVSIVDTCDNKSKENICYYTSWGGTMPDANLCTIVIYSFADTAGGVLTGVWSNPLKRLKQQNPSIKVLLAVGGWNYGVTKMTELLATEASRQKFADHSVNYLRNLDFDGLDLDFEYPGTNYPQYNRYSPPEDKQKFSLMCQQIRKVYEAEAEKSGKRRLMLTVAVGCRKPDIVAAYEIDKMAEAVDYINLMTYDLRGGFDSKAGHHSALYAGDYEKGDERVFNTDWAVDYFIKNGAPLQKLILGLASYGKSFKVQSQPFELGQNAVFADWHGYSDTCGKLKAGWTKKWLGEQKVPIISSGNVIVGYDDLESIRIKAEYALEKGLGGTMWWSLDHDDASGSCGQGRFPLINEVNKVFKASDKCPGSTTTKKASTTTTTQDQSRYDCATGKKFVAYRADCTKFVKCSDKSVVQCPEGLRFSSEKLICDFPTNVECIIDESNKVEIVCENGLYSHPESCSKYVECINNQIIVHQCKKLSVLQLNFDVARKICDLPTRAKTVAGCA